MTNGAGSSKRQPILFLGLDILYVAVLVVLLIGRQGHFLWVDRIRSPIGGIVPVAVPWFGALGAVTISIYGIVDNYNSWQSKWNLWHIVRPVVGAILGTVAFLIFVGVIQASGNTPTVTTTATGGNAVKVITYLLVAFVVGYREDTFRTLIKKVVDILLSPGDTVNQPTVSISPAPLAFGNVAVGDSPVLPVTITNTGSGPLVIQGPAASPPGLVPPGSPFAIADEAIQGATINPGSSAIAQIKFSPTTPGQQSATLTLNCNAGQFPVSLTGTGTGTGAPPPAPDPAAGAVADPGAGAVADPGAGAVADPGAGAVADPGAGAVADPGAGAVADPGAGAVADPGAGAVADPGAGAVADPGAGAVADPGAGAVADPGAGAVADPGAGAEPEPTTEAGPAAQADEGS